MKKTVTETEKAVLYALAAGYLKDWRSAYICAYPKGEESAKALKSIAASVTHWKQHPEIIKAYQEVQNAVQERDQETTRKALERAGEIDKERESAGDSERTTGGNKKRLDYYDPANQRRQINAIIAQAEGDPKTQLDAIKAIQQTQRDDKQAAKDNKIQRFYMPVTCSACPLMEKARKKAGK